MSTQTDRLGRLRAIVQPQDPEDRLSKLRAAVAGTAAPAPPRDVGPVPVDAAVPFRRTPDTDVPVGERAVHAKNRLAQSFVAELPASILESVAILAKALDERTFGQHEGQAPEDLATFKAAQALRAYAEEKYPTNPELQGRFMEDVLPGGFGTLGAFLLGGVGTRVAGGSSAAFAGTAGAGSSASGSFREARAAGATEEDATRAAARAAPLGALEAIPVERMLGRGARAVTGGRAPLATAAAAGAVEEALQEGTQTVGQNIIAGDIYDPDRGAFEGLGESLAAGAITGGVASAGVSGAGRGVNAGANRLEALRQNVAERRAARKGEGRPGPMVRPEPDPMETPAFIRRGGRVERELVSDDTEAVRLVRPEEAPAPVERQSPDPLEAVEPPRVAEAAENIPEDIPASRPFERLSDDELRARFLRNVRLAFATGAEGAASEADLAEGAFRQGTSKKAQFVDRGRSRGMTTQAENRSRTYEQEFQAREVDAPHPDEAFVEVDPADLPASVRGAYESAIGNLPDIGSMMNESLLALLDDVEQNAVRNRSNPVAQIERAIVSGHAHSRGLFSETPELAKEPGIPFRPKRPAEAQESLFDAPELVSGSEQRDLGLGEAPRTLERTERLARQTVDRLRPLVEGGKATEAQAEAYREALALTRRGQGQSAEEVALRSQPSEDVDDGASQTGDLFADPGTVPSRSAARTDPRSADPLLTEKGAQVISAELVGNLETPAGFRGRPTAAPEVIRALEDVTVAAGKKIRVREGRAGNRGMPGFAAGAYFPTAQVQRVRQANNLPVATHETAHALEQLVFGRQKESPWTQKGPAGVSSAIQSELVRMGKELYGDRKPNGGYKREGWAEFVRMWVTQTDLQNRPVDLTVKAPEVSRWFDEVFSKEYPEVRKALEAARAKTTRFREQGSVQRAKAGIIDPMAPKEQAKRAAEGVREFFGMENWVEMALPLAELSKAVQRETGKPLAPTEDPYVTISALRTTHDARVRYMVEEGMIDLNGNRVGDPLVAIRNIVKGRKDDFMIYLWARRTIAEKERGQGRATGLSLPDARQIMEELESPGFQLAAAKVYEWNDGVLNYAAQSSPTFKAVVDQVRAKDPGDYIPLLREFQELDRQWARSGGAGARSPVKRFKGSGRRIKDPFQAMIGKASQTVAQAHKRRILDQIIKLAAVPGVGDLIVEVPKDQRPAYASTINDLLDQINRKAFQQTGKLLQFTDEGGVSPLTEGESDVLDQVITFFMPVDVPTQQDGENPILPIYDEGKVRWFEVDRKLYDTLASVDIYRLPKVADLTLGVSARAFRAGTTGLRASFGLVINPLRDVQTMYVNTQSSAAAPRVFFEWLRSMGEVSLWRTTGKRTEWVDAFVRLGMEMSQPLGQDIRHTRRAARRVFEGRTVRTLDPRNWYDWFRDLMQTPESAPRIAELRMVARDIGWEPGQPMSHAQALQLMRAASEVTTDFKAAGRLARIVNQAVSFHNAGIQGPRAHVRALKRNPMKFVARGLQLTAVSLLLWWENKDEEWWTQMDSREKYLYTHIPFDHPVTGTPELLRIPRAFEVGGIFMAMPEFLADAAYRQDPEIMAAWAETFVESSAPPLIGFTNVGGVPIPYLENPALETFAEQLRNRRFYFDTPIVPRGEEEMPAEEQFNEYTTRVAILLGDLFNASPRRIDHAMQGLFGPVSRDLAEVLGLGPAEVDRDKELADLPVVGRLFQRGGRFGTRPKVVDELYEMAEEAVKRQHSERHQETEEQRQMRLQLQDATRAITALSFVRQYTPGLEERKQLTQAMAGLAQEAVRFSQAGVVDRERFASQRKGAQTLKERMQERREALAAERDLGESRKDARARQPQ